MDLAHRGRNTRIIILSEKRYGALELTSRNMHKTFMSHHLNSMYKCCKVESKVLLFVAFVHSQKEHALCIIINTPAVRKFTCISTRES